MSNLGLFVVGTLVTLLVTGAMALLFYGAVLDGRDERARLDAERDTARQKNLRVVDAA
jgi:hypothetical protein